MPRTTKKAVEGSGDVWTWTAIDADSKLIISWFVGWRSTNAAYAFLSISKTGSPIAFQLTSDACRGYIDAMGKAFVQKLYGASVEREHRYSLPACLGTRKRELPIRSIQHVLVERQNLTMRMPMRRFTRLTKAFGKNLDNDCHALALLHVTIGAGNIRALAGSHRRCRRV